MQQLALKEFEFAHCETLIIEYHLCFGLANSRSRVSARFVKPAGFQKSVFFSKNPCENFHDVG